MTNPDQAAGSGRDRTGNPKEVQILSLPSPRPALLIQALVWLISRRKGSEGLPPREEDGTHLLTHGHPRMVVKPPVADSPYPSAVLQIPTHPSHPGLTRRGHLCRHTGRGLHIAQLHLQILRSRQFPRAAYGVAILHHQRPELRGGRLVAIDQEGSSDRAGSISIKAPDPYDPPLILILIGDGKSFRISDGEL